MTSTPSLRTVTDPTILRADSLRLSPTILHELIYHADKGIHNILIVMPCNFPLVFKVVNE